MSRRLPLTRRALLAASLAGAGCRHTARLRGAGPARAPLATPPGQLRPRYDVVVVGSGYGGAIMAARLAGSGRSLCVLERGAEWLPGDFPETFEAFGRAVRLDGVQPLGLFEFNVQPFADLDVVSGSGLGGTSLINAAIGLRPDPEVFAQDEWPRAVRQAARDGTLDAAFARAEGMLQPRQWAPPDGFIREQVLSASVTARGGRFGRLPLAIHRGASGPNAFGVAQGSCHDCGNCCTGCNVGAKNTLATNYLPLARTRGAELHVGMEVIRLERRADGWRLHLRRHLPEAATREGHLDAGAVVLAAGSVGSTEVLLRSRQAGLGLSPQLGSRVSANGDVLGLSYAGARPTGLIAQPSQGASPAPPPGPALQGYGAFGVAGGALEDRFLLIDGTIPRALVETVGRALAAWGGLQSLSPEQRQRVQRDLQAPPGPEGALENSMLLLACGHDRAGGRYVLAGGGRPRVEWPSLREDPAFQRIEAEMAAQAALQGGHWLRNPRSTAFGGGRYMATHPLGGCPMGETVAQGVVDHASRVFRDDGGVHPDLYVVDAAIIPRSLGVPPLLTLSALAERAAALFLQARHAGAAPAR